jgi:hypothetical protein
MLLHTAHLMYFATFSYVGFLAPNAIPNRARLLGYYTLIATIHWLGIVMYKSMQAWANSDG